MAIYWIDDELDILELLQEALNIEFIPCKHWDECQPVAGDLVIHDINGVGQKKEIAGVKYLTCSGSVNGPVDIEKPFDFEEIDEKIRIRLSGGILP